MTTWQLTNEHGRHRGPWSLEAERPRGARERIAAALNSWPCNAAQLEVDPTTCRCMAAAKERCSMTDPAVDGVRLARSEHLDRRRELRRRRSDRHIAGSANPGTTCGMGRPRVIGAGLGT